MQTHFKGKHLLCEQDWTNEELETLFKVTEDLKMKYAMDVPHELCKNKSLFMLFFEESTRTRNAFECGITQLGGHANYLTPKATQIDHGETAKDTIEVLSRMGHGIGIRNTLVGGHKWMAEVAKHAKIPVYNMQCDIWHPTQSICDLYTIREKFGTDLRGRKFVISWTSAPNYVRPLSMAQSLVALMPRFGLDVTLAHPEKFDLMPEVIEMAKENARKAGAKFEIVHDMDQACKDADIIYAKGWGPIMHVGNDEEAGLKLIDENPGWLVDSRRMKLAKESAIYMHCMPADRDVEVTSEVMDGPQSVLYDQAENRMHTIKALMALTMGNVASRR
ncbi:ornithine carbamoyltransferase [Candidatus Formimonas warabiya]|uniref:Ornithine carbamoyltransferase n=1 Tax=Formimonas warabiya TaxID=1761012 RepID=A0A3G1KTP9_FORW1|nr:ornithine carbamoyltransferase [Candidatus Formimonas warabiya]ATW25842.1 ornithine carbamoyltransferase [Candidatus Formimonas warabiya]